MEYRGIKLAENVKLYNKDGSFYKKVKDGLDIFADRLKEKGHETLSEYKGNEIQILIDFKCGHEEHWIEPKAYKTGKGCPKCGGTSSEQAKEDLISLIEHNGHEWVNGEYINTKTKILINFKCEHEPNWIEPSNYKNGKGCPICNESKGERKIRNWLDENKLIYESQKEFDGLVGLGRGNLSYDFYLPIQNILIEYQGEFHDGSSGEYSKINLEYQQEHDRRKKEYAKKNEIVLLVIWYWDFDNIEDILIEWFSGWRI